MSNNTQPLEKSDNKNIFQIPKKDKARRLEEACYGNSRIGSLLDYFAYGAEMEIKYKRAEEDCSIVTLKRTHEEIMETLPFKVSRKTLIRYLNLIDKWGYVTSEPYSRYFDVHGDKIQEGLSNPPEKLKRPYYDRHPQKDSKDDKGCNSTTLQPLENENTIDSKKVVTLHKKVVEVNNEVVTLHKKVDILSPLQPYVKPLLEMVEAYNSDPYRSNRSITVITGDSGVENFANPNIVPSGTDSLIQSLFDLVSSQAKQIAEMKLQLDQLTSSQLSGVTNADFASSTTATGPNNSSMAGVHDTSVDHGNNSSSIPTAPGTNVQGEITRTSGAISRIANEYTKNDIVDLTICNGQHELTQEKQPTLWGDVEPEPNDASPAQSDEKPKRKPLTQPDASMPWNEEKAMLWANYFRKYAYPEKKHKNSKHYRAYEAAELIIQREIDEKQFVYVFKYMKGTDPKFCSDYWAEKDVDIWNVNEHFDGQVKEIKRKKAAAEPISLIEKREEKLTVGNMHLRSFRDNPRTKKMLKSPPHQELNNHGKDGTKQH